MLFVEYFKTSIFFPKFSKIAKIFKFLYFWEKKRINPFQIYPNIESYLRHPLNKNKIEYKISIRQILELQFHRIRKKEVEEERKMVRCPEIREVKAGAGKYTYTAHHS